MGYVCETYNLYNTDKFKRVIFNAARDGKLCTLKMFLEQQPNKKLVEIFLSIRTNDATPLLMACRHGHLDVVKFLIEKCDADMEQVGSVIFDETVEGATPLWCAAAAGHFKIAETLVIHGASVNCTTKTNSTPLRAACFDGHYEIVCLLIANGADMEIANRHGHTCLMIACYKGHYDIAKYLIDRGADINRKSLKGNTALHDCAKSGSLEIFKLLLKRGVRIQEDICGITPLLSAAIAGHSSIIEYFLKEYNCPKKEKVNVLELLGATFIDKKHHMHKALEYWKQAMYLRYEDSEFPLEKPYEKSPIASYVDATEVRTFDQLEELITDPDEMRMQALLVRERILGPGHPDTVYYIRYRGGTYADYGNFGRCIQLWKYALDVQQQVQEPFSPMTQSILLAFTEVFMYMMSEARGDLSTNFPAVSFSDVLHVFKQAVTEIETALIVSEYQDLTRTNQFHSILVIAMHLICLMCKLQPTLNHAEEMALKRTVCHFVHLNPKSKNGSTLLHMATHKDSVAGRYPVFTFPSHEVVSLLLEVGACPNALDAHNNAPLHVAAMNNPCARTIFKSLLDHGAHLDVRNSNNQTPLQLANITSLFNIYPLRYINLQCLCAQAIDTYKISYKGLVHRKLNEFLDLHCSR